MPLNFYVRINDDNNGTYGSMTQALGANQSFGSYGAGPCVIVLVEKTDGHLFCGHMSCGLTGIPANQQQITNGATALMDCLDVANKRVAWHYTTVGGDRSSGWMVAGIQAWFNGSAAASSGATSSGYFSCDAAGTITVVFDQTTVPAAQATQLSDGLFSVE